jgi:hypothetical protein
LTSSFSAFPFPVAPQTLAGQFDAMGVVNEAVQDRVGVSGVPDDRMMPRLSMGWFLKFGFSLGATGYSAKCFPLSA